MQGKNKIASTDVQAQAFRANGVKLRRRGFGSGAARLRAFPFGEGRTIPSPRQTAGAGGFLCPLMVKFNRIAVCRCRNSNPVRIAFGACGPCRETGSPCCNGASVCFPNWAMVRSGKCPFKPEGIPANKTKSVRFYLFSPFRKHTVGGNARGRIRISEDCPWQN